MADYSIWVLEYSYVTKYHKSGVLYGAHNEGYVKLPYCYALIKGKNHVAMVDVGYNNKEYGKALGDKFGVDNWHSPKEVLAGVGLTPADVDTVFISHAHFDHFGNVEDFPKATFYIQEREITKWVWAMSLPDRLRWMMVAVDPGDIIRGGDLARVFENIEGPGAVVDVDQMYVPVGLAVGSQENLVMATEAMMKSVGYEARRVIPVHEERLKDRFPSRITADGLRISEIRPPERE